MNEERQREHVLLSQGAPSHTDVPIDDLHTLGNQKIKALA